MNAEMYEDYIIRDVRAWMFPYALKKLPDGYYVFLNREYKPLGTVHFYDRDENLTRFKIKGLTPKLAAKLSWAGSEGTDMIMLYNDDCVPTHSKANMDSYLEKLRLIMKLDVSRVIRPHNCPDSEMVRT